PAVSQGRAHGPTRFYHVAGWRSQRRPARAGLGGVRSRQRALSVHPGAGQWRPRPSARDAAAASGRPAPDDTGRAWHPRPGGADRADRLHDTAEPLSPGAGTATAAPETTAQLPRVPGAQRPTDSRDVAGRAWHPG